MGHNNGRTSERVYNDIVNKSYFLLSTVCDKVNKEFNLTGTKILIPQTIQYWNNKGYITYPNQQGSRIKVTADKLEEIKALTFLHIVLGINYNRLSEAVTILKGAMLDDTESKFNLLKYTQIYDTKIRKQQHKDYISNWKGNIQHNTLVKESTTNN